MWSRAVAICSTSAANCGSHRCQRACKRRDTALIAIAAAVGRMAGGRPSRLDRAALRYSAALFASSSTGNFTWYAATTSCAARSIGIVAELICRSYAAGSVTSRS